MGRRSLVVLGCSAVVVIVVLAIVFFAVCVNESSGGYDY